MQEGQQQYDLYRVYEMGESQATLRVTKDLRLLAKEILKGLAALPAGVTADSISVKCSIFHFDDPIEINLPDEPEEE